MLCKFMSIITTTGLLFSLTLILKFYNQSIELGLRLNAG